MIETANGTAVSAAKSPEFSDTAIEKLTTFGQATPVYSAPVVAGAYTVITASEVVGGGGFGFGNAQADTGGGGGRAFYARPVASIVIGPDGVKVQPIPDATKIALAGIAAWAGVALMAIRLARASRRRKLRKL